MSRKTEIGLKEQLKDGQVIAPYIYDCMTGIMAENTGFRTFILSAPSVAMTYAMPDLNLLTCDDMIQAAARVADFLLYPVITDFANGFSQTAYGVYHNVKRLLVSGSAAVMIDDTTAVSENNVVEELFYAKIVAAKEATKQSDCLVVAVTNAKDAVDLEEAIKRLKKCKELGADIVMCRGLTTMSECKQLGESVDGIKILDEFTSSENTNSISIETADEYGFHIAAVRYVEKASLYGLMQFGLQTKKDNTTVYTDYHDYDGKLPSMDHHLLLSNQWRDVEMEIKMAVKNSMGKE